MKTSIADSRQASLIILLALIISACFYDNKEDLYQNIQPVECMDLSSKYTADIVPILNEHCIRCHRNGRQDGNVNLEGYQNVKVFVDDGSLYGTTNHDNGYSPMPTSGIKIPYCQIEQVRLWIEQGALNN